MQLRLRSGRRVLKDKTVEATIIRLAHRRGDAHVRRDAGQDQIPQPTQAQEMLEVGVCEGAAAWLVDDGFAVPRPQLIDDIVALLAAD